MSDGPIELSVQDDTSGLDRFNQAFEQTAQHTAAVANQLEQTFARLNNLGGQLFDVSPTIAQLDELRTRIRQVAEEYRQAAANRASRPEGFQAAVRNETRAQVTAVDQALQTRGTELGIPPEQLTALRTAMSQGILSAGAQVGRELQGALRTEYGNLSQLFGRYGSLGAITPPKSFLGDEEPTIRRAANSLIELANAATKAAAPPPAPPGQPPRPPAASAAPPPEEPEQRRPRVRDAGAAAAARAQATTDEEDRLARIRRENRIVRGGPTGPELRQQQQGFFREGLASGRLQYLGSNLATDENRRFYGRDQGPLNYPDHPDLVIKAEERLARSIDDGTGTIANVLREANRRIYNAAVASGQVQPLGGARSPIGYDRTRDEITHKDFGRLNEGLAAGDPELQRALREGEARLAEFRRQQGEDARRSIANSQRLTDADNRAREARLQQVVDTLAESRQRREFLRQQERLNAGEQGVRDVGKYVVDVNANQGQGTVQRREGGDRLVDVERESGEAVRAIGVARHREAQAAQTAATQAERKTRQDAARDTREAREQAQISFGRGIASGRLERLTPTGTSLGTFAVDRTTGQIEHRNLGPLDPNNPEHAPQLRVAQERLAEQSAAAIDKKAKADADAANSARREADARQAAADQAARTAAEEAEFARQIARYHAGDPALQRQGRYIVDRTDPNQPTVQRQEGRNRLVDVPAGSGEANDALGDANRRLATARAEAATRQNRENFRQRVGSGELQQLGTNAQFGAVAVDRGTGVITHRDLGELSNTNPEHAPELRVAQLRLGAQQAEAIKKTISAEEAQERADRSYVQAVIRAELAQERVTRALDAKERAELLSQVRQQYGINDAEQRRQTTAQQQSTYQGLSQRERDGDPTLRNIDARHVVDTSGPEPQVFRRDAKSGTAEQLPRSEADLVLANEELTRSRREAARAASRSLLLDTAQRELAGDPSLRKIRKGFYEDTSTPQPSVIRTNDATGTARRLPQAESELLLATERATVALNEQATAARRARFNDIIARHVDPNDTSVRQLKPNVFEDTRSGTPQLFQLDARTGTARDLTKSETDLFRANEQLAKDRTAAGRSERELAQQVREQSRRGVLNNFLTGVSNPGFGNGPSFDGRFDGLARSAGQLVKYQALSGIMNALQQAAAGAAEEFLNMDDSVTELQVAMGTTSDIAQDFANNLQNIAAVGGFNVGESMDVAAKGIRAFKGELESTNGGIAVSREQMQGLGEDFSKQASRLAVLATTTLEDSAGNLAAVAQGYNLQPNTGGFQQVTDAVAGAKLAGGGDETQIYQGLANSAVTFQQMGFSLREAATIISTLNAQTDQSGQLLATRVSRLGAILEGQSGKDFIRDVNDSRPVDTQAVDLNASAADQIGQLSALYKQMDEAQRQVLTSRLGGTAQSREILLLLKDFDTVKRQASNENLFDNAGAEEFEKRLTNVRAVLTQIQGNVKAIVTNLALSGLADPFVTLLNVLRPLTQFLRDGSQAIATFAQAFGPLRPVLTNLAAIMLTLRGISAIRSAGGFGAAFLGVEQRIAPGRALARRQLAEPLTTKLKDERAISGLASDARVRAQGIIANATVSDADKILVTQAQALAAAATALEKAEVKLAAAAGAGRQAAQAEVNAARQKLNQEVVGLERAEQRRDRQGGVDTRINGLERGADARYRGGLADVERDRERVQSAIDARAARIPANQGALGRLVRGPAGATPAQQAELDAVEKRRIGVERAYNAELLDIAAKRRLAEAELRVQDRRGGVANQLDASTGGVAGRFQARRLLIEDEGLTRGQRFRRGARTFFSPRVPPPVPSDRIGAGSGLLGALGGPAGVALITAGVGLTAAFNFKRTMDEVAKAQSDAASAIQAKYDGSAESLRLAAEQQTAAANELREASSGFFGGLADAASVRTYAIDPKTGERTESGPTLPQRAIAGASDFFKGIGEYFRSALGGDSPQQADKLDAQARYNKAAADSLDKLRTAGAAGGDAAGLAAAIDDSSVDKLTASLHRLREMGYSAAQIIDAFNLSLGRLDNSDLTQFTTDDLTKDKQSALATSIASTVPGEIQNIVEQYQGIIQTSGRVGANFDAKAFFQPGANGQISGAEARANQFALTDKFDSGVLQQQIRGATQNFLASPGLDLNAASTRDAYEKAIRATLDTAKVPPDAAKRITAQQGQAFATAIAAENESFKKDPTKLITKLQSLPVLGEFVQQDTTFNKQFDQQRSGARVDTSASAGLEANLNTQRNRVKSLQPIIATYTGDAKKRAEAALAIEELNIKKTQLEYYKALASEATAFAADQQKIREAALRNGATIAQLKALGGKVFQADLAKAVASGNVDVIVSILNQGSKAQLEVARQSVHDTVTVARRKYDNDVKLYDGLKTEQASATLAYEALLKGSAPPAAIEAAKRRKDAADAAVTGAIKPNAGPLNAALANEAAFNSAVGIANPTGNLDTQEDLLGGTPAQIQAAKDAAAAEAAKDRLGGLKSNLDASAAALAKAKLADPHGYTKDYQDKLKQFQADQNAYNAGLLEVAKTSRDVGIDLSNGLAVAQSEEKAALDQLSQDLEKPGIAADQIKQDRINLAQKRIATEQQRHSQTERDIDNQYDAGEISNAKRLQLMAAERDRLKTLLASMKSTDAGYDNVKQELYDSIAKLKAAGKEMSGQFNIGDIKIPTVYEVRRAIQASAASASTVNSAVIANTTNNTITINGADLGQVEAVLKQYLGAGDRYTTGTRRI